MVYPCGDEAIVFDSMAIVAWSCCSNAAVDAFADLRYSSISIDSRFLEVSNRACGNPANDEAELIRYWSTSDPSLRLCKS